METFLSYFTSEENAIDFFKYPEDCFGMYATTSNLQLKYDVKG